MSGEGPLERLVVTEEGDAAERVGEAEEEHAGEAEKATQEDPQEDVRRLNPSECCSQSQREDPKKVSVDFFILHYAS